MAVRLQNDDTTTKFTPETLFSTKTTSPHKSDYQLKL